MTRKLILMALLAAVPLTTVHAQDQDQQQSLGDIARQARKAKEDQSKTVTASKGVITEDSLPSRHSTGLSGSATANNTNKGNASAEEHFAAASADFDQYEQALNEIDPMNRSELAKCVLDGNSAEFPGRSAWEEKMFAAKQTYVAHGREMLRQARQLIDQGKSLAASEKTPEVKTQALQLQGRIASLMQDASRSEQAFQAVVGEGQQLANQTVSR
jgi:hypothetical protein